MSKGDSKLRTLSMDLINLVSGTSEANMNKALEDLAGSLTDPVEKKDFLLEMNGMKQLFKHYLLTKNDVIDWDKIKPPSDDLVLPLSTLGACPPQRVKDLAQKLAVLKLNGGLGTTMGCVGPKSAIEVRGTNFEDWRSIACLTCSSLTKIHKASWTCLSSKLKCVIMNNICLGEGCFFFPLILGLVVLEQGGWH